MNICDFIRKLSISGVYVLLTSLLSSGCATIMHGTKQDIFIATTPDSAVVSNGTDTIISPGTLSLDRKNDHSLTISSEGHKTEVISMTRKVSGAVAGNIVVPGGLIGAGIDVLTGAQWEFEVDAIDLELQPIVEGETDTSAHTIAFLEELKEKSAISHAIYTGLKKMALKNVLSSENG